MTEGIRVFSDVARRTCPKVYEYFLMLLGVHVRRYTSTF